jgi:spore germination protein GerM
MSWHRRMAIATSAILLTACGVPSDSSARLVPEERVPEALRSEDTAPPTSLAQGEPADLWFVRDDRLARVRHTVASPVTPAAVVQELLAGPTDEERSNALRSAIPDAAALDSVEVGGGVATVRLTPTFADIPAADQLLAIAQLVMTLTDLRGIGRVGFTIGDTSPPVPLPDGASSSGTVSRDDYIVLATS